MVREYLIRKREEFNSAVKEYGNMIRAGLGDALVSDATAVVPVSVFLGSWIGMNSYTALEQHASGLLEKTHSPEIIERFLANAEMTVQGLGSNYLGLYLGVCAAFVLGSAVAGLDRLLLRERD